MVPYPARPTAATLLALLLTGLPVRALAAPAGEPRQMESTCQDLTSDCGQASSQATQDEPAQLWERGSKLESEGQLLASAQIFEMLARREPPDSHVCWRLAKNYYRFADETADLPEDERAKYLELAEDWADRGLEINDECGECYLYKVGAMGRRLQDVGRLRAATKVSQIAKLLERGISILEERTDPASRAELEELYYAAAQLYRGLPEWSWLGPLLGVTGDRQKAVEYMRKANHIAGVRPSYMVELAASLLCLGEDTDDDAMVREGAEILRRVRLLHSDPDDAVDRRHAGILLEQPRRACDFSREQWLEKSPTPG